MLETDGFHTENFADFWTNRCREVNTVPVVISGIGFDPRSMQAAKILKKFGIIPKLIPINFSVHSSEGGDNNLEEATKNNASLLSEFASITAPLDIKMFDSHGKPSGGREVVNKIFAIKELLENETDIILDIGGLPRSLFAPLLSFLLTKQDQLKFKNLHVASLPDENLDNEIVSDQILPPNYMYGFNVPSTEDKLIWIPIIGKNDPTRLRNIYSKIENNCIEICPVLPFRPNNPRQGDNLLLKLHNVLFNEIRTIHNNIIYIDHRSPFLVYREIIKLSDYYNKLLGDIYGDVKVLITPLDDKTSCVGAVLAAAHKKLPIMYADTVSYKVPHSEILLDEITSEPLEIWVSGEAYDT